MLDRVWPDGKWRITCSIGEKEMSTKHVVRLEDVDLGNVAQVGGKNASLGERRPRTSERDLDPLSSVSGMFAIHESKVA